MHMSRESRVKVLLSLRVQNTIIHGNGIPKCGKTKPGIFRSDIGKKHIQIMEKNYRKHDSNTNAPYLITGEVASLG
jgi:hypothetical protein